MLKTFRLNKIYEEISTGHLYYVRDVKRVKGRNKYLLRKVTKSGSLGAKKECFFTRKNWQERPDLKDEVYIIKSSDTKKKTRFQRDQEKRYKNLVMKTRRLIAEERLKMKNSGNTKVFSDGFKYAIAQYAFCACAYVDYSGEKNKSKYKTVRQFAKDIGMSRNKRYYDWLNHFYRSRFPQDINKLRKHLNKCADRTLVQCRNGLEMKWHSMYGFSKSLNETLETFRDVYESLIFERGIYLEPSK